MIRRAGARENAAERGREGKGFTSYGSYHLDNLVLDCRFCTRINLIFGEISKNIRVDLGEKGGGKKEGGG